MRNRRIIRSGLTALCLAYYFLRRPRFPRRRTIQARRLQSFVVEGRAVRESFSREL